MKGQFFVLGAILLASMFFVGLPMTGYVVKTVSGDLESMSDNLVSEYPKALNLALADGEPEGLAGFSSFASGQALQRNAVLRNLWVVTRPAGPDVNVTVGNFLGQDANVALNISNAVEVLYVPSGATASVVFHGVPQQFVLRVTGPGSDRELELQRDKANLYSLLSLERGEELVNKEIVA